MTCYLIFHIKHINFSTNVYLIMILNLPSEYILPLEVPLMFMVPLMHLWFIKLNYIKSIQVSIEKTLQKTYHTQYQHHLGEFCRRDDLVMMTGFVSIPWKHKFLWFKLIFHDAWAYASFSSKSLVSCAIAYSSQTKENKEVPLVKSFEYDDKCSTKSLI